MKQLYSPHWRHFLDSKQLYYILCGKIWIKGWRESLFFKNRFSKERDEGEKEKVLSEEIGHDGVSLIGGQGLAGKEAQPAEKTEARDLPQNTLVTQSICVTCYMKHKRSQHLVWSEGCILYLSLGSLMASLSRHNGSIADTIFPQSSFDTLKKSMFSSTRLQRQNMYTYP